MIKDEMENHNCDNVNCNHNDTKGVCCLFNPDNCKYRQLQKENAELRKTVLQFQKDSYCGLCHFKTKAQLKQAKEIIKTFLAIANNDVEYVQNPNDCKDSWKELCEKAEKFIKDSEVKND